MTRVFPKQDRENGGRCLHIMLAEHEAVALLRVLDNVGGFGPLRQALDDLRSNIGGALTFDRIDDVWRRIEIVGEIYLFDGPLTQRQAEIRDATRAGRGLILDRIVYDEDVDARPADRMTRETTPIPRHVRAIDLREDD